MKKISAIALLLLCFGCKDRDKIVVSHQWKYGEGYHIGDFPEFEDAQSDTGYFYAK